MNELIESTEAAEELLALCGKVSMGFVAAKLRLQEAENDKLLKMIADQGGLIRDLRRDLESTNAKLEKLKTWSMERNKILHNQIKNGNN